MKPTLQTSSIRRGARRQRGFTLVEMMVAVSIGLVVALGLAVSFVNLKATWGTQDKLAQLQDNERVAMAFLTSSVQEAGYYPDPTSTSTIAADTNATYGNMAAAQFLAGTASSGTTSATLSTAYAAANNDGVLTCQGSTNTSGGLVSIRNVFYVDATNHTLNCIVYANHSATAPPGAASAALVSNVASMDVKYAVDANNSDGIPDHYWTATQLTTPALWQAVKAVRITLNFINPNAATDAAHPTIPWVQTINLMNNQ